MNAIKTEAFRWAPSASRKRARTNPAGWVSMPATTPRPWDIEFLCESGYVWGFIQICTNPAAVAQQVIDDLATGEFSICETAQTEEIAATRTEQQQEEQDRIWRKLINVDGYEEPPWPRTATLRDRPVAWRARMMSNEEAQRQFGNQWNRAITGLCKWRARDA